MDKDVTALSDVEKVRVVNGVDEDESFDAECR